MTIIDFHTHTFPSRIAPTAIRKLQEACRSQAFTDGTASALYNSMQKAGIGRSVVLPVATNPEKVRSMNDVSIQKTGKDGLIYFGCIHPDTPYWHEELNRIAEAGLKGIKIHPVYQNTDIDDIRYLRILDLAGKLGLIVVMHSGYDLAFPGVIRCSPSMTLKVLRLVGPIKLVMAHMGGWRCWGEEAEALTEAGVYIDTAFSLGTFTPLDGEQFSEEELKLLSAESFCSLVHTFGSERVLFGTDSPWYDQKQSLEDFLALPLSETEKRNILGENGRRLLDL
ncbi:MAG: amidohydrolase family protein [Eubacteriales bacterium]|nr:amidohydrolase family protein [Eubacteriales bacterium]